MERELHHARSLATFLLVAVLAGTLASSPAGSQGLFGQNKIQYDDFDWRVMKTPHVDLHFYPEEEEVAIWVADVIDEAAEELLAEMQLTIEKPIPFLLYSTPGAFQQTNASPFLIAEEVGGLTDLIKGRVMVPHNGSYHMLRWVVRHELVHAFMLEKLRQVLKEHKKTRYSYPPLWYVEGLAEFLAATWDSKADMILRDAVINKTIVPIPQMWRINGTFQMYKQGQSILLFVEREFGRDKVLQFLDEWYQDKPFEQLAADILGITLQELSDRWMEDLKLRYYPQVGTRDSIEIAGRPLVEHGRFSLRPCPLPHALADESDADQHGAEDAPSSTTDDTGARGDDLPDDEDAASEEIVAERPPFTAGDAPFDFVFLSSYQGFTNIRAGRRLPDVSPRRGPSPQLLVKGGTSERFESLHFFQNSLDANQAREVVFIAKSGDRDAVHIFDVDGRTLRGTLQFPELIALRAPGWSPDGNWITFSGVGSGGHRDVYIVRRDGSELTALTDDHFDDLEPDWSPDGRYVVFASDRCPEGESGSYNLFLYDLERQHLKALTSGAFEDKSPAFSADGRLIAFRSNRGEDRAYDLYVTNLAGDARPVARCQTALMDPEWAHDGESLLCTTFLRGAFRAFQVVIDPDDLPPRDLPPVRLASTTAASTPELSLPPLPEADASSWKPEIPDTTYSVDHYRRRFGLDLVTGGVAYDPEFGNSAGGGQIVLSDLLGNERLQFFIANDGGGGGGRSFIDSFDVGFTYLNLSRRMNWGVGAFRLSRTYNADLDLFLYEARVGGIFLASYPLSRFNRVETSIVFRTISDHLYRQGVRDDTFLVSNFFSYVHDTTLWNMLGPFSGMRYNITFGLTTDLSKGLGDFSSLSIDFRRYVRLLPTITYAFRGLGRMSFGREGPAYFAGGPFSVRGYPRRSIVGQRLVVINNELRFPVVRRFLVSAGPGLVDLPLLNGATFFDVAWAGDPVFGMSNTGSYGVGLSIGGGPFPRLRIDWSWLTNFRSAYFRRDTEFSVGFDF